MLTVECPNCNGKVSVPEQAIGKPGICGKCRRRFIPTKPEIEEEPGFEVVEDDPNPPAIQGQSRKRPLPREGDTRVAREARPSEAAPHNRETAPPKRADVSRKRKKKAPAKAGLFAKKKLLIGIGGGGLLGLGLLVVLVVWLVSSLAGGGKGPAVTASTLEPQSGEGSWVSPLPPPDADPGQWKVTADGTELAADLQSAFPALDRELNTVVFAAPSAAKAAILQPAYTEANHGPQHVAHHIDWVQLDLRKSEPPPRVPTLAPKGVWFARLQVTAALSPSGRQLAIYNFQTRDEVVVWSADGKEVVRVGRPDPISQSTYQQERINMVTWVGFPDESSLLVCTGNELRRYDLSSGELVYTVPVTFSGPPSLSPGRKWLAGFTGKEFSLFSCADGSVAGSLPLPEKWYEAKRDNPPGVAFHPNGKSLATVVPGAKGHLLIGVHDLGTGQVQESFVLRFTDQENMSTKAAWCGDRRLLLSSGHLVDLDYHTWLTRYMFDGLFPWTEPTPDGRYWSLREIPTDQVEQVASKLPSREQAQDFRKTRLLLAAATIPSADATRKLEAAQSGFLWHPGVALRLEVDRECPAAEREQFADAFASHLASYGYRIDPAAEIGLRLVVTTEQSKIQHQQTVDDPKLRKIQPMAPPGQRWVYVKTTYSNGYKAHARLKVTDRRGELALNVKPVEVEVEAESSGQEAACEQLRSALKQAILPRLYLRDAQGVRLRIPYKSSAGIDGIIPPGSHDSGPYLIDPFALTGDKD